MTGDRKGASTAVVRGIGLLIPRRRQVRNSTEEMGVKRRNMEIRSPWRLYRGAEMGKQKEIFKKRIG